MQRNCWRALACVFVGWLMCSAPARAADEEIQVYMDEMGDVGKLTLDVHVNHTLDGRKTKNYPQEMISNGRTRITPEWSYSYASNLDIGFYLPLTEMTRDGVYSVDGAKLRLKWLAPHSAQGLFGGVNFEIGRVDKRLDINPWNAELKGIIGTHAGNWTLAANTNFGWAVSGPATGPLSFELATKASYAVTEKTAIGLESFNDFGPVKNFTRFKDGDQRIFAVVDTEAGGWDFNAGVGYGYGDPEDRWVLKLIVGTPLGK